MRKDVLFMVVTNDELELPVVVGDRHLVAEFLDIKPESLSSSISRGAQPKDKRFKVLRQEIENDI